MSSFFGIFFISALPSLLGNPQMTQNSIGPYEGLVIRSHRTAAPADKPTGNLTGWQRVDLSPQDWVSALEAGNTIQPSTFQAQSDGTYTHTRELWQGTHFFCADADNFKGIDFAKDGVTDLNPDGINYWMEQDGLSRRFPNLQDCVYAVGESVSSMVKEPNCRRYRLIFLFDEMITSAEDYKTVLEALYEQFPIICTVRRAPSQPVFGNARDNGKFTICGNLLKLSDYLKPASLPTTEPVKSQKTTDFDKTLEAWLRENSIPYRPTKTPNKFHVDCPNADKHASGKNTPTDAYVSAPVGEGWLFHCSHATCQQYSRSNWDSFKAGHGIKNGNGTPKANPIRSETREADAVPDSEHEPIAVPVEQTEDAKF